MHEIICPHCGKAFKIHETGYEEIHKQVRDSEFDQQLHERLDIGGELHGRGVGLCFFGGNPRQLARQVAKQGE